MSQEQLSKPEAFASVPVPADGEPQQPPQQEHKPEAFDEVSPIRTSDEEPQQKIHKPEAVADESTVVSEEQPEEEPYKPVATSDIPSMTEEQANAKPVGEPVEVSEKQEEQSPHHKAVTYGDVFPAAAMQPGPLASEAITMEDASLMQTAEAMAFGHTLKGGAASTMQSAAAKNVAEGFLQKDAHSIVSEYGLSVSETSVPGATMDIEYVAGQPVSASAHPTPTDPAIAGLDAVTIGEALEAVAVGGGDRPIDESDARAIASAEKRATGVAMPMKGGIGATAQSAAQLNHGVEGAEQTTLSDVLMDATADLPADKVVTYEDAFKVVHAELHGQSIEHLRPGGVGASLIAAADLNEQANMFALPEGSVVADERSEMALEGDDEEDDPVGDQLRKYQQMNSSAADSTEQSEADVPPSALGSEKSTDLPADLTTPVESAEEETAPIVDNLPESTKEQTTPLVSSGTDEKLPNHGSEELPAPKQTEV